MIEGFDPVSEMGPQTAQNPESRGGDEVAFSFGIEDPDGAYYDTDQPPLVEQVPGWQLDSGPNPMSGESTSADDVLNMIDEVLGAQEPASAELSSEVAAAQQTASETSESQSNQAPVEQLRDNPTSRISIYERPRDGYYAVSNNINLGANQSIAGGMTPELRRDLTNNIALRDRLCAAVFLPEAAAAIVNRENNGLTVYFDGQLPPGDTVTAMQEAAQNLTPDEALGYFVGKLESHTNYLRTGEQPTNWPELGAEASLASSCSMDTVSRNAEIVGLSLDRLQAGLGERGPELTERFQSWATSTSDLLLSRNLVGRAAQIINNISPEESQPVLANLTEAMQRVRETEGDDSYRDAYGYITRTLNEPLRDTFVQQCERISTPPIPGSQRELEIINGRQIMTERFTSSDPVRVRFADGDHTELPYDRHLTRILQDYDSPTERERYTTQDTVEYDSLDPQAQAAIQTAWEAEVTGRLREETLPHYARLALDQEEMGGTLHTVRFRDGYRRTFDFYPDDGTSRSQAESQLDRPVVAATPVLDTYMVVPYRPEYRHTYRDAEPNFFGPGEEHANAFWVTGQPRAIVDREGSPKLMQPDEMNGHLQARWTLVPIRYYQVEQQRQSAYDDEDASQWRP